MRVNIEFPEKLAFTCHIALRVDDMNYGNHLGNERILVLAHESRVQFFRSLGCTEFDLFGVSIIQADAAIVYKSEGHIGDVIRCDIAVADLGRSSFNLYYRFYNQTTDKLLALCKTGTVCFNYNTSKVVSLPDAFTQLFG